MLGLRPIITGPDGTLQLADESVESVERIGRDPLGPEQPASERLRDVERAHITRILTAKGWRIEGRAGAAEALGLKPSTLRSRMEKLDLHRPPPAARQTRP